MTLADELDRHLRPGTVSVSGGGAQGGGASASADVVDLDRLGVSLRGLRVTVPGRTLREAVGALPDAVGRALGEPLVVTEVAPALGGAVLRSPVDRDDREFYEVRTDGEQASVERWRVGEEGRERVPFTLTRKDLGRVVEGLGAGGG